MLLNKLNSTHLQNCYTCIMHLFIIFTQLYKGSSVFGEARCRVQRLPTTTSLTTSITTITQEPRPLTTNSGPAPSSTYYITNQVTDEKDEFGDKSRFSNMVKRSSLIFIIQYISMLSNWIMTVN